MAASASMKAVTSRNTGARNRNGVVATPLRFLAPVFRDVTAFIDAEAAIKP